MIPFKEIMHPAVVELLEVNDILPVKFCDFEFITRPCHQEPAKELYKNALGACFVDDQTILINETKATKNNIDCVILHELGHWTRKIGRIKKHGSAYEERFAQLFCLEMSRILGAENSYIVEKYEHYKKLFPIGEFLEMAISLEVSDYIKKLMILHHERKAA